MITDSQHAGQTHFDVCIIGAGPAGISLALELDRRLPRDRSILLIEFGNLRNSPVNELDETIELSSTQNHHPPYECTNKGFGGSSATWGGRCVMYDEVDFLERPIIGDNCTWDRSFLDSTKQWISRAMELNECGTGPFDLATDPETNLQPIAEGFTGGDVTDTVVERWSMPTRFGPRYRHPLEASDRVFLLDGWMADRFPNVEENGEVTELILRKSGGDDKISIRAQRFIVSAGTQETTRLLLKSRRIFRLLGSPPESLGCYYQGHVSGKIASVQFSGDPRKTDFGFIREPDGTYIRRRFQFPAETLCRKNLLNTAIWLDNPLYFDPGHRSGAMSFMYLAMITPVLGKRLAPPAIAESITKGKVNGIPQHLRNILLGLPSSLMTPASIFFRRYCLKRKLPGVFLYSPQNCYALHFHAEQVPVRDNRMELGADGEKLIIHYRLTDDDVRSAIRCHQVLDHWLRKCNCGHLEYWYAPEELEERIHVMSRDGIHQSGTTRIGDTPEKGVVDRNLRVHGTKNVFICSSSVFPTSGQANPTFFMCVLAARLAEHLATR